MCKNKVYLRSNRYYTNTKSIKLNCKWIQLTVSENCHVMNLIKKKFDVKLKLNYLPWNINLWLNIKQSLSLNDQLIYKTKLCLISQTTNKHIYG
jgi:hypothetical protein